MLGNISRSTAGRKLGHSMLSSKPTHIQQSNGPDWCWNHCSSGYTSVKLKSPELQPKGDFSRTQWARGWSSPEQQPWSCAPPCLHSRTWQVLGLSGLFHPLSLHELSNEIIDATSQVGKKMAKDNILHGCTKNWVTLAYMHFQKVVYSDRLLYL